LGESTQAADTTDLKVIACNDIENIQPAVPNPALQAAEMPAWLRIETRSP
jgi:hypothetical protein